MRFSTKNDRRDPIRALYSTSFDDVSILSNPREKRATAMTLSSEVIGMNKQNREHIKRAIEINDMVRQMYGSGHPNGPR